MEQHFFIYLPNNDSSFSIRDFLNIFLSIIPIGVAIYATYLHKQNLIFQRKESQRQQIRLCRESLKTLVQDFITLKQTCIDISNTQETLFLFKSIITLNKKLLEAETNFLIFSQQINLTLGFDTLTTKKCQNSLDTFQNFLSNKSIFPLLQLYIQNQKDISKYTPSEIRTIYAPDWDSIQKLIEQLNNKVDLKDLFATFRNRVMNTLKTSS